MGRKVWYPAVSGPLSAYAAGYVAWMRARSYSPSAISDRLWQFDQLSRWLDREGLPVVELTLAQCLRFAASRRAAGVVTLAICSRICAACCSLTCESDQPAMICLMMVVPLSVSA